ncbi:SDR family NAD(P)-dependent oxidoreductase [Mycobacterium sp. CBMA271]|uniref:nocobactin polyketide synthase NbtC n=1 Tax=unclassified Mycobacteroides TaxID=2618759 RepID=UPI00132A9807|nr:MULTISPECIES: nocobactin polyketide synthase NbtC [unclassified Mycobacteroides]MUM18701.1 polyketide synthase [Mycobacteroides sp. CBMA 326]MUM22663.1 SDR family NAD(P)-dependent oxidoreductase [Mycobacteroides sp. CBMA 271]
MLRREASALLAYVLDHPRLAPNRIAGMLFRTRTARRYRALIGVTDHQQLVAALRAVVAGEDHPLVACNTDPATARRVGFVFPGQGGQRPGMGRLFYDASPEYRAEADRCSELFASQFGRSPLNYLLDEGVSADDSASVVQPALFTQMAALAALWRSVGVNPDVTIGHSQGEIAAAYISGVTSLADAVTVVGTRARIADGFPADDYAMAVIAADRDTCERLLARQSGWAELSVMNSPMMMGISGQRETVHQIVERLTEDGVFARVIPVQYPAHTSMIASIGAEIRKALVEKLGVNEFVSSEIECIGATLGGPLTPDLPVDQYWFWNLRNIVRFDRAVATAAGAQIDTYVELAEHPTLQLAIRDNLTALGTERAVCVVGTSTRTATDLGEFTANLANLAVHDLDYNWDALRTAASEPVSLPLRDFPNVQNNDIRLWLSYRRSGSEGSIAQAPAAAPEAHPTERVGVYPRLLRETWTKVTRRTMMPPRSYCIVDATGKSADLAAALCDGAADFGSSAQILDSARESGTGDADTLVIVLPAAGHMNDHQATAAIAEFFGDRTWWPELASTVTECWIVTVDGEQIRAQNGAPHPVPAAIAAGFRCMGTEHPGIAFRHLDVTPDIAQPDNAGTILAALQSAGESELALRPDGMYAKRVVDASGDRDGSAVPDTAPKHLVIVGGTGKLGQEFCEHYARLGSQRITLISRSGETDVVSGRLEAIRRDTGADVRAVSCDVTDASAVATLAEGLRETPADQIIHAAVDYSDMPLAEVTAEKFHQALRAKVGGIVNVLDALPRTDSCRVMLCSSLSATIGGKGQLMYSAGNRMLDVLAVRQRAAGLDCVSVQWGQWTVHLDLDDAGIAKLAAAGVHPMRPVDALAVGMGHEGGNTLVGAFDLAQARSVLGAFGYGPLLSELADDSAPAPIAEVTQPSTIVRENRSGHLVQLLAEVIGADHVDSIDTAMPMVAMGLDSLQALEFRRRVQAELNFELPVADLLGGASVDHVIEVLGSQTR